MKIVIEIYVSIFILCMAALLCIGFIEADVQVSQARDAHSMYVQQIRDSNYSDTVIEGCKKHAMENGYSLEVTLYDEESENPSCKAVLTYEYSIAVLNIRNSNYIEGYSS